MRKFQFEMAGVDAFEESTAFADYHREDRKVELIDQVVQ